WDNSGTVGRFGGRGETEIREIASKNWRRRPELNRGWRFCRPLPYRLATAPLGRDRPVVGWSETGRATCGDSDVWSWTGVMLSWQQGEDWSGKRDSNPRLRPWQGRTLPLSYSRSARHAK